MNTSHLRVVAAWLQGQSDAGVDLNCGIVLPLFLKPQLSALLKSAVLADEDRHAGADPFERGGVWHRAVNRVMFALSAECKVMTAHFEYPHGLGLADGAFNSFMSAIAAMGIDLPSDEEIAAADAARAAVAAQKASVAVNQPAVSDWDDAEAYEYN